ncbi:DMT family transporter [Ferroacidibacillus organovorans]|uniref:DMT family transporter n=1 Tax=Ferroacidibacillus organovorans TaxID=1765683 RepID=UPI001F303389|nr:DMT family transporter [Ferroacidibacillus organovorans]
MFTLNHYKGVAMVLFATVFWGVSGTAAQVLFQQDHVSPYWLVTVRMSVSGLLLLLLALSRFGIASVFSVWRNKQDVIRLILLSFFGLLGVQYTYFASIQYGNAATSTLLQYVGPIFITIYLALRNRRLPRARELAAIVFALFGIFLLVTNGNTRHFEVAPPAVVWGLLSALTVAFYTLYPQILLKRYDPAILIGWGMLLGGLGLGLGENPFRSPVHTTPQLFMLVSFVVLFGTLIAFYMYIASLNHISASVASLLACGEPLSAAVIAVTILHVRMGLPSLLGASCILITVTLLARKDRAKEPPPEFLTPL